MSIDLAITRLQDLIMECTTVTIKSAPDYPIENADPFPMSIAYVSGVSAYAMNGTTTPVFPVITLEIHFSRVNLRDTYIKMNSIALELPRRIAGDPTLSGTVDTVIMTRDEPIEGTITPFDWGGVKSEMLKFQIRVKMLETPI